MGYQLLDHTADAGLLVTADSLAGLYGQAAMALFDQIVGPVGVGPEGEETLEVSVSGADREDLLVNWLREVLYLWNGRRKLVRKIEACLVAEDRIIATVTAVDFDPERHRIEKEIKAITYHQVSVTRTPDGWQARFIVDI